VEADFTRQPRVNILNPGPGVGGHCIAVDPWFIVARAPEQARLIRTAREVNDYKPEWVIAKVKASADKFKKPVIGCLGLSFKADVDDLRESPSVEIVRKLIQANVGVI
jgi:UDP-N-acetyl-D-mannosaminuronic acid dehydrogenase